MKLTPKLMTVDELSKITVPFADAPLRLKECMDKYGVVMVTDVVSPVDLAMLERCMQMDLQSLLRPLNSDVTNKEERRCTAIVEDRQCKITTESSGHGIKQARTLRSGESRCAQHMPPVSDQAFECHVCKDEVMEEEFALDQWTSEMIEALGSSGRVNLRGLPQGNFAWGARLLQNPRRCWEILFENEDLVVGLDMPFFSACGGTPADTAWPHVDQNDNHKESKDKTDERGYQGVLYVWPSDEEESSTTVVMPESHGEIFGRIMADAKCPTGSRYIPYSHMEASKDLNRIWKEKARRVPVPAGALLLWDSRTSHQGWASGKRLAMPISWEPRIRRSEDAMDEKMKLCVLGLASTHSASLGNIHPTSGIFLLSDFVVGGLRISSSIDSVVLNNSTMMGDSDVEICASTLKAWEAFSGTMKKQNLNRNNDFNPAAVKQVVLKVRKKKVTLQSKLNNRQKLRSSIRRAILDVI
jgi:hypothetical protein